MKYYKLIKNPEQYPSYTLNKIYPENYSAAGRACAVLDHYNSFLNRKNWIKVSAGEYFVQEGIMPEYFAIKMVADNPLWEKYIGWLNKKYIGNWSGNINHCFYGFGEDKIIHGACTSMKNFGENSVELTLEQWDKIVNKTMEEDDKEIIGWKLKEDCKKNSKAAFYICTGYTNDIGILGNVESSHDIEKLKEAGVLELWFEPVYKEKTLQFGGYDVIFEKVTSGVRITCNGETGTFSQIASIYNYFKPNSIYFKFGSQEVKKITYGQNGSWNLENESDNPTEIKIGCTAGTWEEFTAIYEKAKSML